jgi:hypothetical protein
MLNIRRCVCFGLFLAMAGLSAPAARAQGSGSGIAGIVVSKQSGQAVPGAIVAVKAAARPQPRTGRSADALGDVIRRQGSRIPGMRTAGIAVRAGEPARVTVDLNPTPNYRARAGDGDQRRSASVTSPE